MTIFLIIFAGIVLYNIKISKPGGFFEDYSAPKQTAAVNGIFSILIFLSHSSQYLTPNETIDKPYSLLCTYLGQLVVATFLFFSGYGMMESISKKGQSYIKSMPSKRLFKTWYHFAATLVLFLITNQFLDIHVGVKDTLLSFTGLTSLGNSNWYMFVTFVMYILIFIAFMIAGEKKLPGVLLTFVFTLIFAFVEYKCGLPSRFYNTVFCLPAGMLYSILKPKVDKFVMKKDSIWYISTIVITGIFLLFGALSDKGIVHQNLCGIFMVIAIMLITMKFKIGNPILDFLGRHIFSFFILQRIPMRILDYLGISSNKYVFIILSLVLTIAIALAFDAVITKTDKLIFQNKKSRT